MVSSIQSLVHSPAADYKCLDATEIKNHSEFTRLSSVAIFIKLMFSVLRCANCLLSTTELVSQTELLSKEPFC